MAGDDPRGSASVDDDDDAFEDAYEYSPEQQRHLPGRGATPGGLKLAWQIPALKVWPPVHRGLARRAVSASQGERGFAGREWNELSDIMPIVKSSSESIPGLKSATIRFFSFSDSQFLILNFQLQTPISYLFVSYL